MGKGFGVVVTLAVGIAMLIGGVLWWIGPNLASLAFTDSRRAEPYLVAEFVRGEDAQLSPRYLQPLQQLVFSEGATAATHYQLQHMANGQSSDEWRKVLLYQLPQAQTVAQIMTSSPYGLMQDSVDDLEGVRVGTYARSEYAQWRPGLIIFLAVGREDAQLDPLVGMVAALAGSEGRVVLDAHLDVLNSAANWQRMLVADFASVDAALAWLNLPEILTQRDVTNSANREFAVLLYQQEQAQVTPER